MSALRPDTNGRPTRAGDPDVAAEPLRSALAGLLLAMADDEFVIGFTDSEWTGIAPLLEEDVAMSSISQDELGHARALYELLAGVVDDGRDGDAIAYDREPAAYRHARLLDGGRGDWATTIARRYLYDSADAIRLEALTGSAWAPLAGLAAKVRREETYHLLHAATWLRRLAMAGGESRERLERAMLELGAEAWTVLATLPDEPSLTGAAVLPVPSAELDRRWRARIEPELDGLGLPRPAPVPPDAIEARTSHGGAFRRLHAEFTSVRRLDPAATW